LQTDKEKSNHIILRSNDCASFTDVFASKSDDTTSIETENSNDAPEQTNLHCNDEKVRPKVLLERNSKSVPIQPEETKVSHDYIVTQDFIQEVSSGFTDEETIEVVDILTTNTTIEVELAYLFLKVSIEGKNTIQAKQKEISCRYSYGKRFEIGVQELIVKKNISEQTIGVDKIKNIKTFSADSISKFTQPQIQIILDYFNEGEKVRPKVPLEQNGVVNHVSNTDSTNIISRADMTKKTSPIAQASAPPIFEPEVDI
ncbi:14415_t:CDS:2, partial [Racocetra persica]